MLVWLRFVGRGKGEGSTSWCLRRSQIEHWWPCKNRHNRREERINFFVGRVPEDPHIHTKKGGGCSIAHRCELKCARTSLGWWLWREQQENDCAMQQPPPFFFEKTKTVIMVSCSAPECTDSGGEVVRTGESSSRSITRVDRWIVGSIKAVEIYQQLRHSSHFILSIASTRFRALPPKKIQGKKEGAYHTNQVGERALNQKTKRGGEGVTCCVWNCRWLITELRTAVCCCNAFSSCRRLPWLVL